METVKIGPHTLTVNTRVDEYRSRVGVGKTLAYAAATQLVEKLEGPKEPPSKDFPRGRDFLDTVAKREELLKDPDALAKVLATAGIVTAPKAKAAGVTKAASGKDRD